MITYKKISLGNRNELTEKVLEEMYLADTLISPSFESFEKYAKYIQEYGSLKKPIIYLIQNDNKILGAALGKQINNEIFKLNYLFIHPNLQKKGIGTKLLFHIVADIRTNTKYKFIDIAPLQGTKEILDKLACKRKMKNNSPRTYNSQKFKYSVIDIPEIHTKIKIERNPKSKSVIKNIHTRSIKYINAFKNKFR